MRTDRLAVGREELRGAGRRGHRVGRQGRAARPVRRAPSPAARAASAAVPGGAPAAAAHLLDAPVGVEEW
ncbi:hypothetical protein [Amycolatopsis suaedae]|uniref:Uncharacterized protein n=1 Tax=Amycolatopsis suaedae TaxID=2510978 RepID=A0A4V2EM76_9PSEU|nr:hypothetical protein [Amycolatopsis suaedae]RZQ64095.1 hypothetical protein EWH70_08850 [Amycolatopsis suaedae]